MPVHVYGGSISVNATRTVAAVGKIESAPGNAEAKQVEDPYPGGQEKSLYTHTAEAFQSMQPVRLWQAER